MASGAVLSFTQDEVTFSGHAIECRINAENPETFAPSPGRVDAFSLPGGPGIRIDTFVHAEATVPPNYDSLIAKVMAYGRTREEAIARMRRALEMTVIEGIHTSVPMHLKILADVDFQQARISTAFMDRFLPPPPAA
jgi:acetyl-CoA carboxylase biotin carboxylase subunit